MTPSFNQGRFLEATIRSVLLQRYPKLEYAVIDGGSSDNSVEIIKKYEPWLTFWTSSRDDGQADAINRGFDQSSGDVFGWINSDDFLLEGALRRLVPYLGKLGSDSSLLVGGYYWVDESGNVVRRLRSVSQTFESLLVAGQLFGQMACFWNRSAFIECGGLRADLQFCFDYDLFLKLLRTKKMTAIPEFLAAYREHSQTKTSTIWETVGQFEAALVQANHGLGSVSDSDRAQLRARAQASIARARRRQAVVDAIGDPRRAWAGLLRRMFQ